MAAVARLLHRGVRQRGVALRARHEAGAVGPRKCDWRRGVVSAHAGRHPGRGVVAPLAGGGEARGHMVRGGVKARLMAGDTCRGRTHVLQLALARGLVTCRAVDREVAAGEREAGQLVRPAHGFAVDEGACRMAARAVRAELAVVVVGMTRGARRWRLLEVERHVAGAAGGGAMRSGERKAVLAVVELLAHLDRRPGVRLMAGGAIQLQVAVRRCGALLCRERAGEQQRQEQCEALHRTSLPWQVSQRPESGR